MFEILGQLSGGVVGLQLSGRRLQEDRDSFLPELEALLEEYGGTRCLIELVNCEGVDSCLNWDRLKRDANNINQVEYCAVVGGSLCEPWARQLGTELFHNAQYKYFDTSQISKGEISKAWKWVTRGIHIAPSPLEPAGMA